MTPVRLHVTIRPKRASLQGGLEPIETDIEDWDSEAFDSEAITLTEVEPTDDARGSPPRPKD